MRIHLLSLLMPALSLLGCSPSAAKAIDTTNDVHCAIVMHTVEMNAESFGFSDEQKSQAYVLRTWYYLDLTDKDVATGVEVAQSLREDSSRIKDHFLECGARAIQDPKFHKLDRMIASKTRR